MSWKKITIQVLGGGIGPKNPNPNPNPLGISTKTLTADSEKELRSKHKELLDHEKLMMDSRKDLAQSMSDIGFKHSARLLSEVLGKNVRFTTTYAWWKKARWGLRANFPKFDWQENCVACSRPLDKPVESVSVIKNDRGKGEKRLPLTEEESDRFITNAKRYYETQSNFRQKLKETAVLIKQLGPNPVARLFNVDNASLSNWIREILFRSSNSMNVSHFNPDNEDNCMECKRPLLVEDTAVEDTKESEYA